MSSTPDPEIPLRTWLKDDKYLISTDPLLIPLHALNTDIFGASDFTWGGPLPEEQLRTLVHRSLCFGLYELVHPHQHRHHQEHQQLRSHHPPSQPHPQPQPQPQQPQRRLIGFARFITDLVTVNYLTDVYILHEYRSRRLGVWLMECIDEVFVSIPHLRGMILIADRGSPPEEFYRKYLAMGDLAGRAFCMDRKGQGGAGAA